MTAPLKITIIALEKLKPSATNPRKYFDEKELADLSTSIKEKGILEPLLVRAQKDSTNLFEIVAGERRFRASKLAKIDAVPCIIRELTDQQVLEIQVVENLQRQDLTPLEEARGYKALHEQHAYSYDELAAKIGKSKVYVYQRLRLLGLSKRAQALLEKRELPVSYAIELLTVARHEDQDELLDCMAGDDRGYTISTLAELREEIEQLQLILLRAPFNRTDEKLLPKAGSCMACPKRTGAQADLLGIDGKKDACLDSGCYALKVAAHNKQLVEKKKAEGKTVIEGEAAKRFSQNHHGMEDIHEVAHELTGRKTWAQALASGGREVETVVVVRDGQVREYAKEAQLKAAVPVKMLEPYYRPGHGGGPGTGKPKAGSKADEAGKAARRKRLIELKATRQAWPAAWQKVIGKLAAVELKGAQLRTFSSILVEKVVTDHSVRRGIEDRTKKSSKALLAAAKSDQDLRALLWQLLLGPGLFDTKLSEWGSGAVPVFKAAGVDWIALRDKAAAEIESAKAAKAKAAK